MGYRYLHGRRRISPLRECPAAVVSATSSATEFSIGLFISFLAQRIRQAGWETAREWRRGEEVTRFFFCWKHTDTPLNHREGRRDFSYRSLPLAVNRNRNQRTFRFFVLTGRIKGNWELWDFHKTESTSWIDFFVVFLISSPRTRQRLPFVGNN